jgi:undecaprenyl-diphosphatase
MTRRHDLAACAVGLVTTGAAATSADRHPSADRHVFSVLNHHRREPTILQWVQQAGTPWVLPATALIALASGRGRLAVAAAIALPVEKFLEVGIKKARPTPRPLYVEPTVLRDDAPVEGGSYPSGHAAIAFTAATLVAPHLSVALRPLVFIVASGAALTRVSQGAHHPVDVIGGVALGVAVASGVRLVVGQ